MHKECAQWWVSHENNGGWLNNPTNLIAVETACHGGVVTVDTTTGEAVVWSVGYAARKTNGCYKRLTPKKVRTERLPGTWRERRDAAKTLRVNPA